jgi:hypothetical protein
MTDPLDEKMKNVATVASYDKVTAIVMVLDLIGGLDERMKKLEEENRTLRDVVQRGKGVLSSEYKEQWSIG